MDTLPGPAQSARTLDGTPPTGTLVINDDAPSTTSADVTLALTEDDGSGSGTEAMRFSNDGAAWSEWVPFNASSNWTLTSGAGEKTVYAELRDGAGLVSLDPISDTILLEEIEGEGSEEGQPEGEGLEEGQPEGTTEGQAEGMIEGVEEGQPEGMIEGVEEGQPEGMIEGEGIIEGMTEGITEGEGSEEGTIEGEGVEEGQPEGQTEGQAEGMIEGVVEGSEEGSEEGLIEGEGVEEGSEEGQIEGEGSVEEGFLTADQNQDNAISLSELLRVIQFFNSGGFHCQDGTEDGYAPGPGDQSCAPYESDYNPTDWEISLSELLRVIQFFNSGGYHYCPEEGTEDGFCPGLT
ncbi:MAG TPA: hypothetical protein PLI09_07280, partial [Candidatus Hydrogenedentes bacterium]|nr:hypothetical protein [Candidatus Hydrogenedentota bacterium]